MNKTILIGNVGGTPEVKVLESGTKVANFSLATNENYTKKDGTKIEQTYVCRNEKCSQLFVISCYTVTPYLGYLLCLLPSLVPRPRMNAPCHTVCKVYVLYKTLHFFSCCFNH